MDLDNEDDIYEQALVDDVDWTMDGSGMLVRPDEDEDDEADNFEDLSGSAAKPVEPRVELTIFD